MLAMKLAHARQLRHHGMAVRKIAVALGNLLIRMQLNRIAPFQL